MRTRNWGTGMLVAALLVSGAWACSDDDESPANGAAGSGGEAGEISAGGSAGMTAGGHDTGGAESCGDGDCPVVDSCGPYPLDALCESRSTACPTFEEAARIRPCQNNGSVELFETTCGGKVIVEDYGLGSQTWGFDAEGQLTYVASSGDVIEACEDDQGQSWATVWGEKPCGYQGAGTSLCEEAECSPDVCDRTNGRFVDCPDNLQHLNATCFGDSTEYSRYESDCGGTIIEAADGIQTARFSFDADGKLVGSTWSGDVGDSACWGAPCNAIGREEPLDYCQGGASGGGAGGNSGAGGSP